MRRSCRINGPGHQLTRMLTASLLVGLLAGAAGAKDRYVVKRDGTKIQIHRSETEFAITLKDTADAKADRQRMAKSGVGVVEDIPWAPNAPVKLLRVTKASQTKRGLLVTDQAIDQVFPVYRYVDGGEPVISTGTVAMRLRSGLPAGELDRILEAYFLDLVEPVDGLDLTYLVKPSELMGDEVLRAEALALDRRILWAEPNFRSPVRLAQFTPSDPLFGRQWYLNNTGQSDGTVGADINVLDAWDSGAEGQDVLIGMLDDACDVDHPDLVTNYLGTGHNPTVESTASGSADPRPKIINDRHGTAVMGLAVARANGIGIRGVSPLSQFTASRGLGQGLSNAGYASAYTFARQQGVDVHINSWGLTAGAPIPAIIEDAIETAFIDGRDLDEEGPDPPRGMVVVFASGNGDESNVGLLLGAGDDISTLPTVIGVGASTIRDGVASYSNYGPEIDVLAPGGGDFAGITTTDVNDAGGYIDKGYNVGGSNIELDVPDFDTSGLYNGFFEGTSAACPIAAGVAALTLSINSQLTATDVRLILEHTAAKVSPDDALYDGITNRSTRYGYGRLDAAAAVQAAQDSLRNGGYTWPDRPARVVMDTALGQIRWTQNGDPLEFRDNEQNNDPTGDNTNIEVLRTTDEFLVLASSSPFSFLPEDGVCYSQDQLGCGSAPLQPLPQGVSIEAVGCGLTCGVGATGTCEAGASQCVGFAQTGGKQYFAIYARTAIGRYSFGVSLDTDGVIRNPGSLPPRSGIPLAPGDGGSTDTTERPTVSIEFAPRTGVSPLTVSFRGNALSTLAIDDSRTVWDFDIDDGIAVDAATRNATYTYVLQPGETPTNQKTFIARLTMFDVDGNIGFAQAAVSVTAAGVDPNTGADSNAELRIVISVPGSTGSDIESGTSPLQVELSVDANELTGTVESVFWDLGDGSTRSSRFVSHTYVNTTGVPLRIPITATVRILSGNEEIVKVISRRVTVNPGGTAVDTNGPTCTTADGCGAIGPGGEATPCGVIGMVPLVFLFVSLSFLRRFRYTNRNGGA